MGRKLRRRQRVLLGKTKPAVHDDEQVEFLSLMILTNHEDALQSLVGSIVF